MVAHNGLCLVHRAEIMQLQGAWEDALEEARRAAERFTQGVLNQLACGNAALPAGRGPSPARRARRGRGRVPRGEPVRVRAAAGPRRCCGWRRATATLRRPRSGARWARPPSRLKRAALLPAYVEIMLAADDVETARSACRELEEIAERHGSDALDAMSAHARASVALAEGDAQAGPGRAAPRRADLAGARAPYEAARARVLVGLACRALGDEDTAALELEAARDVFAELGAVPRPRPRRGADATRRASSTRHGLTARELEVLRLVAAGQEQPRDRRGARDQRAHGRAPPAEHLRQARASRREPPRARSRSSTTWSEPPRVVAK